MNEIVKTAGIFLINKENKLLVAHPTNHPVNFWSITKGRRDEGEDSLTCALRETYEESNIDLRGETIKYYKLKKRKFHDKPKQLRPYVIFEFENDIDFNSFELKCNSFVEPAKGGFPEMDGYQWITIEEAKKIVHYTQVDCLNEIEELIEKIKV
jgi:predicted NUDIX family NTP pyrophosphohydrolase